MASVRQTKSGKYELCISHALLPKRIYFTFPSEPEAQEYGQEAEKWLSAGVVPPGLIPAASGAPDGAGGLKLTALIQRWRNDGRLSKTDDEILARVVTDPSVSKMGLHELTYTWCEAWVADMKLKRNLAPSTIRQHVQAVSRALDWYLRSTPKAVVINPMRLLPRGYSIYSEADARQLQTKGLDARRDIVRERRLHDGEDDRIRAALSGVKRNDRERALPLPDGKAMLVLFETILHTGVRLREAYTLRREHINLTTRVLKIKTTKQRNGDVVYRNVPIRPELCAVLVDYGIEGLGLVFPFWDGDAATLRAVTNRLSHRFASVFAYAGCEGLTEHDLRHEATCRWYEQLDAKGRWMFRDAEIKVIMGWAPTSEMSARYASFRAENLADRLWQGLDQQEAA